MVDDPLGMSDTLKELHELTPPVTAEDMEFVVRHLLRVQDIFMDPFEGKQYKTIPLPYQVGEVALRYVIAAVFQTNPGIGEQFQTIEDIEEFLGAEDNFDFAAHPRAE